jgi:hypothetical protein
MRIVKLCIVCAAAALTASSAWAGFLDRPDLSDVDSTFFDTNEKTTVADSNFAFILATQNVNSAFGYITASTTTTGGNLIRTGVSWHLFEPDKVSRKNTKNQAQQKKWGGIDFFTTVYSSPGGDTITSDDATTSAEKCKIQVNTKNDKVSGDVTQATWKADCKDALGPDGLNLTTAQGLRLDNLLGKSAGKKAPLDVEKDKVKIQGQCSEKKLGCVFF